MQLENFGGRVKVLLGFQAGGQNTKAGLTFSYKNGGLAGFYNGKNCTIIN